jgi:crossover junction endodeoxyribonuclease RuvC
MAKIILGIDPGIADTGFGIIKEDGGRLSCLSCGSIKTPSTAALSVRLEMLYLKLDKLIKDYRPDLAAVEELFFNKNVRTALIVGQARGVALLTLKQNGLPLVEYTPSQVKQAVAAYGQASKKQIQKMVMMILGLKEIPKPDDAADALALSICALNSRLCRKS